MKKDKYKRSLTDSSLYCPYCGHTFSMNYERYMAMNKARRNREMYAVTTCRYCGREFYFRNISPKTVRETGIRAVLKIEEAT